MDDRHQTESVELLAIDLDGTLLNEDREIPDENVRAVRRASEAGIRVVIATGRVLSAVRRYVERLGLAGPVVCSNGAYVVDGDGSEIAHTGLLPAGRDALLDYGERSGAHLNLYSREALYFLRESRWCSVYRRRAGFERTTTLDGRDARRIEATKMLLIDDPSNLPGHVEALREPIDAGLIAVVYSEPEYVEFLRPGVHKGRGVATVARHLGVPANRVAAIGDYLNDLEMIRWAGISGAVANAHPTVLGAADRVVPSNNEAGVARFIDSLLHNGQE
ncbi:MAG: HAD family phosphatase [Fimbriimonadaceae bacterium]|nr:HAD family phosphatase [Fimbriimonadaceae bacterium]